MDINEVRHASAIEWLEMALKKVVLENDTSVKRLTVLERLHQAVADVWEIISYTLK